MDGVGRKMFYDAAFDRLNVRVKDGIIIEAYWG
jgi:hypothetical protein